MLGPGQGDEPLVRLARRPVEERRVHLGQRVLLRVQVEDGRRQLAGGGEEAAVAVQVEQLYRITPGGRDVVRAWLDTPETEPDPDRSIFMLKFFFGSQAGREQLLAQLRAFRDLYAGRLETYEKIRDARPMAERESEFAFRALLYGIARAEAAVSWADATLVDLDRQ